MRLWRWWWRPIAQVASHGIVEGLKYLENDVTRRIGSLYIRKAKSFVEHGTTPNVSAYLKPGRVVHGSMGTCLEALVGVVAKCHDVLVLVVLPLHEGPHHTFAIGSGRHASKTQGSHP